MGCDELSKDLHEYVEGDLRQDRKEALEAHLAACESCRMLVGDLQKTRLHLKDLEEIEPPAWLKTKLMERIRQEDVKKENLIMRLLRQFPYRIPIAATAMAAVAVLSVIVYKSMPPEIKNVSQPAVESPHAPSALSSAERPEGAGEGKASTSIRKDSAAAGHSVGEAGHDLKEKNETSGQPLREAEETYENKPLEKSGSVSSQPLAPAPAAADRDLQRGFQIGAASPEVAKKEQGDISGQASPTGPETQSLRTEAKKKEVAGKSGFKRIVEETYPDGAPKLIVTYSAGEDQRNKLMEERFDNLGRRHGLHLEYYPSGRIRIEAIYDHGIITSMKGYNADGSIRKEDATRGLPWLRYDLKNINQ